jgi:hypothetical protein
MTAPLRWIAALLACASVAASAAENGPPFDLAHLLQGFASIPSSKVRFVEVRRLAALDARVTSRGILSYEAPDRLERETREPVHERYIAEGDKLTMEHELNGQRERREFRLSDFAPLRPFILALRATLSGNLAALQRLFTPTLAGTAADWTLVLDPKRPELGSAVREIRLRGHASDVTTIEIDETGGDSSVITLSPIEIPTPDGGS